MQSWISDQAKPVWYFFEQISAIPRPSKQEGLIKHYISQLAQQHDFNCDEDSAGNLWLSKNATADCQHLPAIMLQAHLDMVCQKTETSQHKFESDPIKLIKKGNYLYADNTTLGADNGIGVAAILALFCSANDSHATLEALLTVDEEAGMGGALGLKPRALKSQVLLNLDSEQDGEVTLGCAGGVDFDLDAQLSGLFTELEADTVALSFSVSGARGGHSGVDIHKDRANAISLGLQLLAKLSFVEAFSLKSIVGGDARNAIPRKCLFEIQCPLNKVAEIKGYLSQQAANLFKPYQSKAVKPELDLALEFNTGLSANHKGLSFDLSKALIQTLLDLPAGVDAWSGAYPEVVETSSNFSICRLNAKQFSAQFLLRSLFDHKRDALLDRFKNRIKQSDKRLALNYRSFGQYPAWQPKYGTLLEKNLLANYQRIFNKPAQVSLMHAGLECGLIGAVFEDFNMISFGPTIESPHSPSERVEIDSVANFWQLLLSLVSSKLQ